MEESTWEREDTMQATYPFLFRDEGTWFSRLYVDDLTEPVPSDRNLPATPQ